jgi:hypothetical protein
MILEFWRNGYFLLQHGDHFIEQTEIVASGKDFLIVLFEFVGESQAKYSKPFSYF